MKKQKTRNKKLKKYYDKFTLKIIIKYIYLIIKIKL